MSIFQFSEQDHSAASAYPLCIGSVQSVDNGKVFVQIASSECLTSLRIGSLVAIRGGVGRFIIAMVTRLWRKQSSEAPLSQDDETEEEFEVGFHIPENNGGLLTLLGALRESGEQSRFTRSMDELPAIDEEVFRISDQNLHRFMNVVSSTSKAAQDTPLHLGQFSLDPTALAYVDGNRLFQRHAALLGSTGSGKSWTVARILEQTANLESSCVILLDLHGEYGSLPYATRYRVAGPADLGSADDTVLYLPHWLLTYEEMQALFVDGSEQSAQNQTLMIHSAVTRLKRDRLDLERRNEVLNQFTVDSPVPFSIHDIIAHLRERNEEMVPGAKADTTKNGPYHGQFTRLIARLEAKRNDRRYGFMYQAPADWQNYEALHRLANQLLCFGSDPAGAHRGIKVIDLSEVPSDVLPVVVGTLARLVFTLQLWTPAEWRHPVLLACDEAHLYLPKPQSAGPLERSAVASVERIAKEGRKYGVGLMVISQRPSDVSETILSQCNNVIALRLTNPSDQQTVRKLLPDNLGPLMQMLPLMEVGEAVVVGDAVLLPTRIRVEAPNAKPSSHTVDFWDRWGASAPYTDDRFSIIAENLRRQERLLSVT